MTQTINTRWRTVDVIVASVIAVAFGVVFWAWYFVWGSSKVAFAFFPPSQAIMYGIWLVPAVLGGLIIRKPGAAIYCEVLASTVSALLGNEWSVMVIPQGFVQGLGAEMAFAALRYRSFKLPAALLAGALAGLGAAIFDFFAWNMAYDLVSYRIPYALFTIASAAVIAGAGSWLLTRSLAQTGALDRFPAGRERAAV